MGAAITIVFWAAMTLAAFFIGKYKGRPVLGVVLGLLLSLLGVIIIACIPRTHDARVRARIREQAITDEAARVAYTHPAFRQPAAPADWPPPAYPQPEQPSAERSWTDLQ